MMRMTMRIYRFRKDLIQMEKLTMFTAGNEITLLGENGAIGRFKHFRDFPHGTLFVNDLWDWESVGINRKMKWLTLIESDGCKKVATFDDYKSAERHIS